MKTLLHIWRQWLRWRKDWDALCNCCGKCCYARTVGDDGEVTICYKSPCEYLDPETQRCTVYRERFRVCSHCGKVGLFTAMFNPTLPNNCPYRLTFRPWENS